MRRLPVLLILAAALAGTRAWGASDDLKPLAEALAKVRMTHGANELRDAGPELTPVKRALRVWVERQLPPEPIPDADGIVQLPAAGALGALSQRMSEALDHAELTCGAPAKTNPCAGKSDYQDDDRGYVGGVKLASADYGRYLLVTTSVGVRCGYDESLYVYKRGGDHKWALLLQSEQDRYGNDDYAPQNFISIQVSPAGVGLNDPAPPPLVLTLGFSPWCASNWQSLYTRLWRAATTTTTPPALIDAADTLYMGNDVSASARLTERDVLIEFQGRSIDSGVLVRPQVRHYLVREGDKLERIAPVALNPNDFVDEWLTRPWAEAARWAEPDRQGGTLEQWHTRVSDKLGEFDGPAKRCRANPALWQVSFDAGDEQAAAPHFLVRWTPPYRFTLVAIRVRPFSDCNQDVEMPDNIGTLFPN